MDLDLTFLKKSKQLRLFVLTTKYVGSEYVGWLNDPSINQYLESRFSLHTIESTMNIVSTFMGSKTDLLMGIHSL